MPLYDFECSCGNTIEAIRSSEYGFIPCPCGRSASRRTANRIAIGTPYVDKRGMFRRYTEATQEIDHSASRVEQSTGQAVRLPNLWKQSLNKARAMEAAGEGLPLRKDQTNVR